MTFLSSEIWKSLKAVQRQSFARSSFPRNLRSDKIIAAIYSNDDPETLIARKSCVLKFQFLHPPLSAPRSFGLQLFDKCFFFVQKNLWMQIFRRAVFWVMRLLSLGEEKNCQPSIGRALSRNRVCPRLKRKRLWKKIRKKKICVCKIFFHLTKNGWKGES